jgi:two-component system, LytTR family, response regulator LytT
MENEIDILLVEDEALIAENIKMQLEDFGYHVMKVCYNYNTALQAITENSFDVLITDINLGDGIDKKSGIQLAQQLQQIKSCPIIFLTAFSDKDTIKKATVLSPSAYLVKPVNSPNLFAAVQLAVDKFSKHQSAGLEEKADEPDYFFIKHGNKMIKLFWKDIYHMEALKNYVKIKTTEYSSGLMLRGSLQEILQNMMPAVIKPLFIKINRAEAIAKRIIQKAGDGFVETSYGNFIATKDFKIDDLQE